MPKGHPARASRADIPPPPTHPPSSTFRDQAASFFTNALGQPFAIPAPEGLMCRWKFQRQGSTDLVIYITMDSPEMPDIAHIMISDPSCKDSQPITSLVLRKVEDFEPTLEKIRRHIKGA